MRERYQSGALVNRQFKIPSGHVLRVRVKFGEPYFYAMLVS
jgi:hypothetical protein